MLQIIFSPRQRDENLDKLFTTLDLVAHERRKRIGTGEMNRFLSRIDFERASVPIAKRVKIYYMTQAAVAPPRFILFTDRAVKLHFSYQRFLKTRFAQPSASWAPRSGSEPRAQGARSPRRSTPNELQLVRSFGPDGEHCRGCTGREHPAKRSCRFEKISAENRHAMAGSCITVVITPYRVDIGGRRSGVG